jgi:alpha-tubulin suppressor-like RCC1 family protein
LLTVAAVAALSGAAGATTVPYSTAVAVASPGGLSVCVLLSNGSVDCWGYNGYGQLGTGKSGNVLPFSAVPVGVKGIGGAKAVSVGDAFACALLSSGTVKCWGEGDKGELGNGKTATDSPTPVLVKGISSATAITSYADHSCALIKGGTVECWGENTLGELGNGTTASSSLPVLVQGLQAAKAVSAADSSTCALMAGGSVQCWGANSDGELGDGPTSEAGGYGTQLVASSTPVTVKNLNNADALSVGGYDSCSLLRSGTVDCWGADQEGELGNGTTGVTSITTAWSMPTPVKGLTGAKAISTGENGSCALLSRGSVDCWGANQVGELGIGKLSMYSDTPVPVKGISTARAISTGSEEACAILANHTLKCWGAGGGGTLGDGTTSSSTVPVTVRIP